MTRPQYAPVPRGYVRVWVLTDARPPQMSDCHSSVFLSRRVAENNQIDGEVLTPLDVPAGAIPGLAATKGRRTK